MLLVEDNPGDVRLLQETLKEAGCPIHMDVTHDGTEALRYLRREREFSHVSRPDLVLLDLSLPGLDGRHVLAEVRSDVTLNGIPIVIFTSSTDDEDVLFAFNFHAEGYLRKPVGIKEFNALVDRVVR